MLWQRKAVARKDMEIERNRLSFSCHFSFSQRKRMKYVIVSCVQHFYLRSSRFLTPWIEKNKFLPLKNNQPLVVRDNFYFDLSSTNLWNLMCFYFVWESSIFGAIDRCFCRQLHVTELRCSPYFWWIGFHYPLRTLLRSHTRWYHHYILQYQTRFWSYSCRKGVRCSQRNQFLLWKHRT